MNDLYGIENRGIIASDNSSKSLYDLIWSPIVKHLSGINHVYFSPAGLLHRINLAAVAVSEEENLLDRYKFNQLNSTRQLVVSAEKDKYINEAFLFGGINYEADLRIDSSKLVKEGETFGQNLAEIGLEKTSNGIRGESWGQLKWTVKEVTNIEALLKNADINTTLYRDHEGNEESFKAIGVKNQSPRILHVATHGFFFPDPEQKLKQDNSLSNEPIFKMSEHPMIRSGLILSGANYAWNGGVHVDKDAEDGILTAFEISQMNLSNTELVVLSACETGLGDIKGNEGVYGLQRAFKIAGAKYIIMSLWQVPDRQTMEFMKNFYSNWLENKMSIPDAFRLTQTQMRDRFYDPFAWAGFILVD